MDARAIADDTLAITRSTTELSALIEYTLRAFPPVDRERVVFTCDSPVSIFVDASRVARTMSRFIELALSASQPGKSIAVSIEKRESRAAIVITTGGMLTASVLRLAFDHARSSLAHGFRGSRGIYVARHAIEAHGGSVSLSPQTDDRMSIIVELPLPLPPPAPRARKMKTSTRVLIVDDNADQLEALVKLLRLDGFETGSATNGTEALASLLSGRADVLLVDVQLPDMKAAELIHRARAHAPQLPAVVMTGYPREHHLVATALQAARTGYVPKPVDLRVLYRELGKAVDVDAIDLSAL
jgi:CheY-like chemotaxis protein